MENYQVAIFIVKYIICLGLFFILKKSKKTETLLASLTMTFIFFSAIILVNFLLTETNLFYSKKPFFYVNFIDFLSIALFVNIFIKPKK
jgi:hypothetical protein